MHFKTRKVKVARPKYTPGRLFGTSPGSSSSGTAETSRCARPSVAASPDPAQHIVRGCVSLQDCIDEAADRQYQTDHDGASRHTSFSVEEAACESSAREGRPEGPAELRTCFVSQGTTTPHESKGAACAHLLSEISPRRRPSCPHSQTSLKMSELPAKCCH